VPRSSAEIDQGMVRSKSVQVDEHLFVITLQSCVPDVSAELLYRDRQVSGALGEDRVAKRYALLAYEHSALLSDQPDPVLSQNERCCGHGNDGWSLGLVASLPTGGRAVPASQRAQSRSPPLPRQYGAVRTTKGAAPSPKCFTGRRLHPLPDGWTALEALVFVQGAGREG
jgi:hypothetical protein